MPIYTLETGDGRRLKIEADTPDLATAEADAWASANPIQREGAVGEAVGNIPSSAAEFAKNLLAPIAYPRETLSAIGQLGVGLGSKAVGALGIQQEPEKKKEREASVDALKDFYKERYGSLRGFEETFRKDPVGLAADLSAVFTLGGSAAARAPGMAGRAGEIASAAGQAIDPLNVAARTVSGAGGLLGKAAAETTGVMSGTGAAPIEQAYRAGREGATEFKTAMRGDGDIADALVLANSAKQKMVSERSAEYNAIRDTFTQDSQILDYAPITKALDDSRSIFSEKGTIKNKSAASIYDSMKATVDDFQANPLIRGTPIEFDSLKQAIGEIRDSAEKGSRAAVVANKVYDAIVNEISSKAPGYTQWMKKYSDASKQIDDVTKTFSLRGNADTAIRKLQSVMRNNVNTNYGQRAKLMDVLAQYEQSLPNVIAGQSMSSFAPRGLAGQAARLQAGGAGLLGVGGAISPGAALLAIPTLAASSPRLVGEATYGLGRVGAGINAIPTGSPASRAGVFQAGRAKEELDRMAAESAGLLGQ